MNPASSLAPNFINLHLGEGPIVAVAIHDGHAVRDEVAERFWISEEDRRREEDPGTGQWTRIAPTRVVGLRSRFEVDLNRLREKSVYITPDDAWGLRVWKNTPDPLIVQRSLDLYDAFYDEMYQLLRSLEQRYGTFFVYDLHSYNHQRGGPAAAYSSDLENPQINLCTGGMDLQRCEPVVACVERSMRSFDFAGGSLDVRRNVRFHTMPFSRWVHENFPGTGVSLGIEVKKFYMNEWTGEINEQLVAEIGRALQSTVQPVTEVLFQLHRAEQRLA